MQIWSRTSNLHKSVLWCLVSVDYDVDLDEFEGYVLVVVEDGGEEVVWCVLAGFLYVEEFAYFSC